MQLNVLISDSHPITALGIKQIVEKNFDTTEVVVAHNENEIFEACNEYSFDVIILCNKGSLKVMKSMFEFLKRHQKDAKLLICGENKSRVFEIPLINMGAHGFILKSGSEKDFVMAIQVIQTGQVYLSQQAINANLGFNGSKSLSSSSLDSLSVRELDVYKLLSKGESVKNICEILELHQSTVSTLKKRVMAKLGVNNIVDMIKMVED